MLAIVDAVAADPDVDGLLVCPCGFVADHLEVLYDLDIEAARPGRRSGPGLRPHGIDERRPRRSSARSPIGSSRCVSDASLVVGGGITGLTVAYELAGLLPDASDRAARGRRPPRRQVAHVAVRRASRGRRGRRRVPRPGPARHRPRRRRRPGRRADLAHRRHGGRLVRRAAPDPRRPPARRPRRHAAPGPQRPDHVAGQGPRRARNRCDPERTPTTRSVHSCGRASATRSTSASSTPSSAASTPPTPTASAWRWCPSWPPSRARPQPAAQRPGRARRRAGIQRSGVPRSPPRAWHRSSSAVADAAVERGATLTIGTSVARHRRRRRRLAGRRRPLRRRGAGHPRSADRSAARGRGA